MSYIIESKRGKENLVRETRNTLTSLLKYGKVVTTQKIARCTFVSFNRLVSDLLNNKLGHINRKRLPYDRKVFSKGSAFYSWINHLKEREKPSRGTYLSRFRYGRRVGDAAQLFILEIKNFPSDNK